MREVSVSLNGDYNLVNPGNRGNPAHDLQDFTRLARFWGAEAPNTPWPAKTVPARQKPNRGNRDNPVNPAPNRDNRGNPAPNPAPMARNASHLLVTVST